LIKEHLKFNGDIKYARAKKYEDYFYLIYHVHVHNRYDDAYY